MKPRRGYPGEERYGYKPIPPVNKRRFESDDLKMDQELRKMDRKIDSNTEFSTLAKEGPTKWTINDLRAMCDGLRERGKGHLDSVRAIIVSMTKDLEQEFADSITQSDEESVTSLTSHNEERTLTIENEKPDLSEYDKELFERAVEELKTELDPEEFSKLDTNVMNARWMFKNKSEKQDVGVKVSVLKRAIKDVIPEEDETDSETDRETAEEQFMNKFGPKNKIRRYRKIPSTATAKWVKFLNRYDAISRWLDHSIADSWFRYREQSALCTEKSQVAD